MWARSGGDLDHVCGSAWGHSDASPPAGAPPEVRGLGSRRQGLRKAGTSLGQTGPGSRLWGLKAPQTAGEWACGGASKTDLLSIHVWVSGLSWAPEPSSFLGFSPHLKRERPAAAHGSPRSGLTPRGLGWRGAGRAKVSIGRGRSDERQGGMAETTQIAVLWASRSRRHTDPDKANSWDQMKCQN